MTQTSRNSQPSNRPWFENDLSVRCFAGATLAVASAAARRTVGDWPFFLDMSQQLLSRNGLHIFADHSNIQSGPASLLAVRLLSIGPMNSRSGRAIVFFLIAMVIVELLLRVRRVLATADPPPIMIPAVVLSMLWWTYFESYGHLDDALVLVCFGGALLLRAHGSRALVGVTLGLAIALKPWSVMLLPLALVPHGSPS